MRGAAWPLRAPMLLLFCQIQRQITLHTRHSGGHVLAAVNDGLGMVYKVLLQHHREQYRCGAVGVEGIQVADIRAGHFTRFCAAYRRFDGIEFFPQAVRPHRCTIGAILALHIGAEERSGQPLCGIRIFAVGIHAHQYLRVIGTLRQAGHRDHIHGNGLGRTIDAGLNILTGMMGRLKEAHEKVLSGVEAFKLNDTFGFPLDLTREIAAEAGFAVDEAAFHIEMTKQRERARAERLAKDISGWSADLFGELTAEPTQFDGYETLSEKAKVLALSDGEELVDAIATDEAGEAKDGVLVVLDRTPFYAEMGGQVADHGYLVSGDAKLKVTQVKKTPKGYFVHTCELLDGTIHVDDEVTASVDEKRRAAICRNHTATHLLDTVLRKVLGDHVHQAGSLVEPDKLRFDFTHFAALTAEELSQVSALVNEAVLEGYEVSTEVLPIEEAKQRGAIALFGEKYGDTVRVVDMGQGFSVEFCGGTHLDNTAKVGVFHIDSEFSVASGVRRIEATTGLKSLETMNRAQSLLFETAAVLKAKPAELREKAEQNMAELREMRHTVEKFQAREAAGETERFLMGGHDLGELKVLTATLPNADAAKLRQMGDMLRDKQPNVVAVLSAVNDGKITFLAVCGKEAVSKGVKAGDIIKNVTAICGGKGGGKPDSAMGGGNDLLKLDDALAKVDDLVAEKLGL